jgi:hypothetical protein
MLGSKIPSGSLPCWIDLPLPTIDWDPGTTWVCANVLHDTIQVLFISDNSVVGLLLAAGIENYISRRREILS